MNIDVADFIIKNFTQENEIVLSVYGYRHYRYKLFAK